MIICKNNFKKYKNLYNNYKYIYKIIKIQSFFRMVLCREKYKILKDERLSERIIIIQSNCRGFLVRKRIKV